MIHIESKPLVSKLRKFGKISKLAQSFAADLPLWPSIIFEKERTLYLGWRFQVEAPPLLEVEEPLIVNFERFFKVLSMATDEIDIEVTEDFVIIHEEDDDGATFELKRLNFNYDNYFVDIPEGLEYKTAYEGMIDDIKWTTIASTKDRMDYTKYGVMLHSEAMLAMDTTSAIAYIDKPINIDIPILLHLPWCQILSDLGEIKEMAQWDAGQQNAYLRIVTEDDFILTIPTLKAYPNPSVESYIKTFDSYITVYIDSTIVKQLEVTTDDAYKFATIYTEDDYVYIESSSKIKGRTRINVCQGTDLKGENVTISLEFLKKAAKLAGKIEIDMDNMVGFIKKDEYMYAFGLG